MLFINTISYYDENNDFRLKEVLVSDEKTTYVLKTEENFYISAPYPMSLTDLVSSEAANISYPVLGFNKMRKYQDDDARALASYLSEKFRALGKISVRDEKTIFDIMSGFGDG